MIVVGAGLAGLACGFELKSAGYEVVILEARDRIGGRVHTLTDFAPKKTVEAGGEFIGSNHPTWLAYAERFHLPLIEIPEPRDIDSPVVLDGKRMTKLGVIALFQQIEEVYARLTEMARPIDAEKPWTSAAHSNLMTCRWPRGLISRISRPLARRALESEFTSYSGVPTSRESLLGMLTCIKGGGLEKYWTENEVYHCTGGNHQLAKRLLEGIGPESLHLQHQVERIAVEDSRATVRCQGGATFEAEDLVLAIPPSTWNNIAFDPPLPAELRPQMGNNVKCLALVREAFWKKSDLPPTSMSDGPIGFTWCATAGQTGGPEEALVAFAGGEDALALSRSTTDERERLLRTEVAARYPDFEENLVRTQFVDWPGQKFTRGSYSTSAPGEVMRNGPILAAGLGRLHFAGEHTCLKFVGYMEGAQLGRGRAPAWPR